MDAVSRGTLPRSVPAIPIDRLTGLNDEDAGWQPSKPAHQEYPSRESRREQLARSSLPRSDRARRGRTARTVLDEGKARARRNQLLENRLAPPTLLVGSRGGCLAISRGAVSRLLGATSRLVQSDDGPDGHALVRRRLGREQNRRAGDRSSMRRRWRALAIARDEPSSP